MTTDEKEHLSISTLVGGKWRVSTIWRECSSLESSSWYYETMVWEWDKIEHQLGKMLFTSSGLAGHWKAVMALIVSGVEGLERLNDD